MKFNWDNAAVICEKDGYRYLLGPESDSQMKWLSAIKWCQCVGGELPSKDVLNECYKNEDLRNKFNNLWYWSSTKFGATLTWFQSFVNGYQNYYGYKYGGSHVRAIKRIKL